MMVHVEVEKDLRLAQNITSDIMSVTSASVQYLEWVTRYTLTGPLFTALLQWNPPQKL